MSIYLEGFSDAADVIQQFDAPSDALDGAEVLLAWYGSGSYCGSAFVLFRKGGKLFEVNSSHCSCYGISGDWAPEETSIEALEKREFYDTYDGATAAGERLKEVLQALKAA